MKTKNYTLIFIICMMSVLSLNAQNVNIPDANFKNALLSYSPIIDANGDGEIQVSEAESYSGPMWMEALNIADLTGIEAFINISDLSVAGNPLTSIDISNNVLIRELAVSDTSLTSLDITQNTMIEDLWCASTSISTLDLSQNINLDRFLGWGGQFTSLDFSQNVNLTNVQCYDNQLTSLNIANGNTSGINSVNATGNVNLTCVEIDEGITVPPAGGWWFFDSGVSFSEDCSSLSTNTFVANEFKIYPNPVQDILQIATSEDVDQIIIYDLTGKQVLSANNTQSINVSQLREGVYMAVVNVGESKSSYHKIIKR